MESEEICLPLHCKGIRFWVEIKHDIKKEQYEDPQCIVSSVSIELIREVKN